MITSLKLTNFRQHTGLVLSFTHGLQVLKGANEAGKSGALEAITYALFGSRALRNPIENVVTWDCPVSSLKVEMQLRIGTTTYDYSRSKGGAQVMVNGKVFCTGQKEVTSLSENLLGADADTASKLLVASQGSIRGALEQGPAALSKLIEDLAGFSTFDDILSAAQEKLTLGSPNLLEDRLKGARSTLDAVMADLPEVPDEAAHKQVLAALQANIDVVEASIPALEKAVDEAGQAWDTASALYGKRVELERAARNAAERYAAADKQVRDLPAPWVVDLSQIETLRAKIAEGEDHAKRLDAYKVYAGLGQYPTFAGDASQFEDAVRISTAKRDAILQEINTVKYAIQTLKRDRFDSDTCSKCGQALPNKDQIRAKNAEIDAKVMFHESDIRRQQEALAQVETRLAELTKIRAGASKLYADYKKLTGYVQFDTDVYPNLAVWKGDIPTEVNANDPVQLRRQIAAIEVDARAANGAAAKIELANDQLRVACAASVAAQSALDGYVGPDADTILQLKEAKEAALTACNVAKGEVILAKREMARLEELFVPKVALWDMAQSRIKYAQATIDHCESDLKALAFNTELVKRLRAIRPIVANKLWTTVLASVSVMFSQMRKEESWITKEKDGFKINGRSVESFSGSCLDLLGLAIRSALLRTFLPNCSLLILDEPCASMSEDRTEALLGFLKSVDFKQTLLVTHESISESFCDNLIQL
jgi:DNA repair exonuclease SbcCD ATPase subunit